MNTPTESDLPAAAVGDPRVRATAWALDQLSPAERVAFEAELAADPALRAHAEEVRAFCQIMHTGFPANASTGRLPDDRRAPVLAALTTGALPVAAEPENVVRPGFLRRHWKAVGFTAAAAGVTIALLREPESGNPSLISAVPSPSNLPGNTPAAPPPSFPITPPTPAVLVSTAPAIPIRPVMPKPLFVGTPLPQSGNIPNLDISGRPTLEVNVPAGTVLLSRGKPVTSSDPAPIGELSLVTDGDLEGDDGYFVDLAPGKQWVQIDLGSSQAIHLLWLWHFHKQNVIFNDVVIQLSDDPEFKTAVTVFNNDFDNSSGFGVGKDLSWVETNNGRAIRVNGTSARYVRLWSNGRDLDDTNQYIEVQVYGIPGTPGSLLAGNEDSATRRTTHDERVARYREVIAQLNAMPEQTGSDEKLSSIKERHDLQILVAEARQLEHEIGVVRESDGATMSQLASATTPAGPLPASEPVDSLSVAPEMPKPLFVGTPLQPGSGRGVRSGAGAGVAESKTPPSPGETAWAYVADEKRKLPVMANAEPSSAITWRKVDVFSADFETVLGDVAAPPANTEAYQSLAANTFLTVAKQPLSTFSIDVDTAGYSNMRRFLNQGSAPPPEAVRIEEMVNYFPYHYAPPVDGKPFAVHVETTAAPWDATHRIARVGLKGKEIAQGERPASNLVFLVDVSGSMSDANKLPLVQQSLRLLTEQLGENDRVALVVYAGNSGVVLPSTNGQDRPRILQAIESLQSGGSTNGASGIELAYQQAAAHFIPGGVNRVILATDGDFNVGATSQEALQQLITDKAKGGVFLSVLGYGMGNLKDNTMEMLADKGNGNYAYIDSLSEARKSLVEQMNGTLVTIAKDVKIQVEFNPAAVKAYRLIGYENRLLAKEDFNDDKKDAGEIGAGHTVTALYELIPAGVPDPAPVVDGLKYQQTPAVTTPPPAVTEAALTGELLTVKLRWKKPDGDTSELMEVPVKDSGAALPAASEDTRWAVAVAAFGHLLRGDAPPALTWEAVRTLASSAKGDDPLGYRGEFLQLLNKAEGLVPRR